MTTRNGRATRRTAAVLALALCASMAMAQGTPKKKEDPLRPPQPTKQDTAPVITTYLLIALLIGGCFGAAAIPAKRGHQD